MSSRAPTVLIILDGWGIAPANRANAISLATTPVFDRLTATYPTMAIQASGEAVGLPWGEMGNSEVGHMNIGAGKIVYQDLPRITKAIADGSFATNPAFAKAIAHVRSHTSTLHLAGLVSSGGIHSFNEHLYALLEVAKAADLERVVVHAFLDGRDTPYNSGKSFLEKLQREMTGIGVGTIASLHGRFWAMDRDRHWDRTATTYEAMVAGTSKVMATDPLQAIAASYAAKVYDEEFVPTVITEGGAPVATVQDGDAVLFFNFRPDRMRQLTKAFSLEEVEGLTRSVVRKGLCIVTMTEYEKGLPVIVAFPPEYIEQPLAKVLADAGCSQLHIAETEKYAHVTFFLNGGREEAFPNEKRVLVPSPTSVTSYDQKPAMSARKITERVVAELQARAFDVVIINFANADMVGHTGRMSAIIEAVEVIDACLGSIVDEALKQDGTVLITADHGNAEVAMDLQTGEIEKEHTASPVPLIVIGRLWEGHNAVPGGDLSKLTPSGFLSDVAPTMLRLMGITPPATMTGRPLLTPPRT